MFRKMLLDSMRGAWFANALIDFRSGKESTYRELAADIAACLVRFETMGIGQGDVVAIVSENCHEMVAFMYAVIIAGAKIAPLNPKLSPEESGNILRHSEAKLVCIRSLSDRDSLPSDTTTCELSEFFAGREGIGFEEFELVTRKTAKEGGLLIYTSGTTGRPKGVIISSNSIAHNVASVLEVLQPDEGHRRLCLLPLFHTFGFISDVSMSLLSGASVVVMRSFDVTQVQEIEEAIWRHKPNSFSAAPLIFEILEKMDCAIGPSSLKYLISGAAPLSEETRLAYESKYQTSILPAYGLTETTCFCTLSRPGRIVPKSTGKPVGIDLIVVDEISNPVLPMIPGEVVVRGGSVFSGRYYKSDLDIRVEGTDYIRTGDIGYLDEEDNLFLVSRIKNMAIRGGEKVYLDDLDSFARKYEFVSDIAHVKVEAENIDNIHCFYVENPGFDLQSFQAWLVSGIGAQKFPDQFHSIRVIPRTPTNKVKIGELSARIVNQ